MRVVLAVLLLVLPSAAWTQPGGDAGHAGFGAPVLLDVVQTARAAPDGWTAERGLVFDGQAVHLVVRDAARCSVATWSDGPQARLLGPSWECPLGARLAGRSGDHVLVCRVGSSLDPLLVAHDASTGKVAWEHVPSAGLPDVLASLSPVTSENAWSCNTPGVTPNRIYAAFGSDSGRHLIEAVDLEGETVWATAVPSSVFLQNANTSALPSQALEATSAFRARDVAVAQTGILVSGRLDGVGLAEAPPGLAWLDLDGTVRGAYVTSFGTEAPATGVLLAHAEHPSAHRNLAAALVGDSLFVVDPSREQGSVTPLGNPSLGETVVAGACWNRDWLFVPGESSAFVVPAGDPTGTRAWPGLGSAQIQACAVDDTHAWVLSREADRPQLFAARVRLDRATTERVVPLAVENPGTSLGATWSVAGNQVAVLSSDGRLHLLGPTTAEPPMLRLEDAYPGLGVPAVVDVDWPAGSDNQTQLILSWGDGRWEEVQPGRYSHAFLDGGRVPIAVTARHPDNRTATVHVDVHVGEAPPPPRSWLDIAFDPDNQELTFTVLGALVSGIMLGITAVSVHRGRHRLERHLAGVDRIADTGRRDPFESVRDLHRFRQARRDDLRKGRLENAQFTVLDAAADRALTVLRQRILGRFVGRVSDAFGHRLDVALADGAIDDDEAKVLAGLVDEESRLDKREKDDLRRLVGSWNAVLTTGRAR